MLEDGEVEGAFGRPFLFSSMDLAPCGASISEESGEDPQCCHTQCSINGSTWIFCIICIRCRCCDCLIPFGACGNHCPIALMGERRSCVEVSIFLIYEPSFFESSEAKNSPGLTLCNTTRLQGCVDTFSSSIYTRPIIRHPYRRQSTPTRTITKYIRLSHLHP